MPAENTPAREDVWFDSRGSRCHAWLYRPASSTDRTGDAGDAARPAVVIAAGLGATKSMGMAAYAERFAAAGYVCLVFDYRFFGLSEGSPRQWLSVPAQLDDWTAAVAHVRSLPGVDPENVVVWGTSFGGGHAISMAARDSRLAAAIAQCPFTDGVASSLAVRPSTSARLTALAVRDKVRAARGGEPIYADNAGAPGSVAFMTAPDAAPGMDALSTDAPDRQNRLTARSLFDILTYSPGRAAKRIGCPIFVALCDPDTVAPAGTARRQLGRAPRAEIHTYPVGHFDIYLGEAFEQAVGDYLDFLARHAPVPA